MYGFCSMCTMQCTRASARVCVYFLPVFTIAWIAILMTFLFRHFQLVHFGSTIVCLCSNDCWSVFFSSLAFFFLFKCHVKKNDDWTWTALWILSTELKWFEKTHVRNAMPACRIPTMKVYTVIIIRLYEIILRCVMWSKVKSEPIFVSCVGWQFIKRLKIACIHYRFGLANCHKITWIQPHKQTQFTLKWNAIHFVHFFFSQAYE